MLAVCCWLSGGACVAMSPVAFFVPTPVPGPMMAVLGALVGLVMCAVGRMVARSLRTLVVAREGIFVSSAEELTGARWEGLVEASVTRIGTKPHLLLQKGGRADNVERICLSTFDVSPEDLDVLPRAVARDEARRSSLPPAASAGVDPARLKP